MYTRGRRGAGGRRFSGCSELLTASRYSTFVRRIVSEDYLERAEDGEAAGRCAVELVADGVLEDGYVREAVVFVMPDVIAKVRSAEAVTPRP